VEYQVAAFHGTQEVRQLSSAFAVMRREIQKANQRCWNRSAGDDRQDGEFGFA